MIDFNLFKTKTIEFVKFLFPDFETCQKYYYDPATESRDIKTILLAMYSRTSENKIENFNFENYINDNCNQELYNYIKTFLPEKFKRTGFIIFNTLAQKILNFTYKNESKIKEDKTLFFNFLKEELKNFFELVSKFSDTNAYIFYSHNIYIEKDFGNRNLLDNLFILKGEESPIFVLENIDFDIRLYWKFEELFIKSLALILGEKINFNQESDLHTNHLKNYGCKDLLLYPINNWSFYKKAYSFEPMPLGPKINIDRKLLDKVKILLPQYINIVKNLSNDDYKKIALDFYLDSLTKFGTAQITYNVIAIESLFNVNRMDIKMNFIQRGLKILQNFYSDNYWAEIENDLEKAYKIRCDYTHGTTQKHKDATFVLSKRISEYTKIILVVFLQLAPQVENIRKRTKEKKFINEKLIDKSLLYPETNESLCNMLNNVKANIKDFDKLGTFPAISD